MDAVGAHDAHVVDVMRRYLRSGTTGCSFASTAAGAPNAIQWGVWMGASPPVSLHLELAAFFKSAAENQRAGVAVFPEFRTAEDVVSLLVGLAGKSNWSLSPAKWGKHARDAELVSLWWRTPTGPRTSVMGFAPLGSMPVTRRAPFVAIAAWTGPKLNPQKSKKMKMPDSPDEVGFVDMPPIPPEGFDNMWDATRTKVRELKALLQEGAALPTVAFCLPSTCTPHLVSHYQTPQV
jgi:hypothetical protein